MIQAARIALGLALLWLPGQGRASAGYKLKLPDKSPLYLRALDSGGDSAEAISLREPLRYLGASLNWSPQAKTADIEVGGRKARLLVEDSWLYLEGRRLRLPSPARWKDGRLIASKACWEALARELLSAAPPLGEATEAELQASLAPTPGAVPTLQPLGQPQILPTPTPRPAALLHSASLDYVVIDAGHGGHDPGATGRGGVEEKEVCLDIARRVHRLMKRHLPGVTAVLTREDDRFISLGDRTRIANDFGSRALFISIHNNASTNRLSRGSQVFYYDSASSDRAAEALARRENEDANYMDILMMDLGKQAVRDPSILLANLVQGELCDALGTKERGLSYAPFYVLARTKMPAILVEVAFISNPREERLLASDEFREEVAMSIIKGLSRYKVEVARK